MDISASLAELPQLHPRLLWSDLRLAAAAILSESERKRPYAFTLAVREVPGFSDEVLRMSIEPGRYRKSELSRVRRTFEPPRLVEFAAIAIAGLALYYAGEHRIVDLSWRGSGADYLVDEERYPLEIAGRSRRADLQSAWNDKWQRLCENAGGDFFVCAAEFESLTGRLAFKH